MRRSLITLFLIVVLFVSGCQTVGNIMGAVVTDVLFGRGGLSSGFTQEPERRYKLVEVEEVEEYTPTHPFIPGSKTEDEYLKILEKRRKENQKNLKEIEWK